MSALISGVRPSSFRDHFREGLSREFEHSDYSLDSPRIHDHPRKEGLSRGQDPFGLPIGDFDRSTPSDTPSRLPSPHSTSSENSQGHKSTALPSIKELEAFPRYLSSSPSDMSRGSSSHGSPYHRRNQDTYSMQSPRDDVFHHYEYRDVHGEPFHPLPLQHGFSRPAQPIVTSISPSEIHPNHYLSDSARGRHTGNILFGERRGSRRNDSMYVKRPRRRAEEVERLYTCSWPGCDKSYGALNHLNTHVRNAEHGPKREPKEFKEVRREQKARLARTKLENNPELFQMSSVYSGPSYPNSTPSALPFEYNQALPRPSAMNPHSYEALPLRGYESPSAATFLPHENYASRPTSSRERHDMPPERDPQSWPTSSPSKFRSGRWSPENYKDLQSRYPEFAEDLVHPQSRAISPRRVSGNDNMRLSPRDMEGAWDDRYDAIGHPSYVQGPNGSIPNRDLHQHYTKRDY